jgi:hypothetical protein
MRAKSYIFNDDAERAINILKDICYILPPFPIENLQFIDAVLMNSRGVIAEDVSVAEFDQ